MAGRVDGNMVLAKSLTGHNPTAANSDVELIKDYYRLQILFNQILFQLKPPMTLYSDADFENFIYSMPNLLTVSSAITNDTTFYYDSDSTPFYYTYSDLFRYNENLVPNYRTFSTTLINTLTQAVTEYYKIKTLENENLTLLSYKEILEDRTKLLEYISEIQKTAYLFSAEATYTNNLEIKLWYQIYLERHGAPGDGVFDSALLGEIIEELVLSGQVSQDELIY